MNITSTLSRAVRWIAGCRLAGLAIALAQPNASGSIEGRISSLINGEFLERVRITVENMSLETSSDPAGYYRLTNASAGAASAGRVGEFLKFLHCTLQNHS